MLKTPPSLLSCGGRLVVGVHYQEGRAGNESGDSNVELLVYQRTSNTRCFEEIAVVNYVSV